MLRTLSQYLTSYWTIIRRALFNHIKIYRIDYRNMRGFKRYNDIDNHTTANKQEGAGEFYPAYNRLSMKIWEPILIVARKGEILKNHGNRAQLQHNQQKGHKNDYEYKEIR